MTDTTDTAALREACGILNDHGYLTKSGIIRSSNLAEAVRMIIEQSVGYAGQLEAERQRCAESTEQYVDRTTALSFASQRAEKAEAEVTYWCNLNAQKNEEIAALKVKLANPVVLPARFKPELSKVEAFKGAPVMKLDKTGGWLNRTGVIIALKEAGFTVKGD